MTDQGLEQYSIEQLLAELINRSTFAGIVLFHRGDVKAGQLDPGEIVMTKSPPLTRVAVETLLHLGQSLVPEMFIGEPAGFATGLPLTPTMPPLRVDEGGVVRVGTSRISLDVVVEQFENGMTAEAIVRAYDSLVLADVHSVIAYYLRHRDEVRQYRAKRAGEAEVLRAKIEASQPRVSREELLSRGLAREKENAPTGE